KASLPPSGMPRYRVHGVTDVPGTETETHVVPELRPGDNAFGHWVIHGRSHQIVPTYLFDEQFYAKHHNDLKTWKGWIFDHFLAHGIREKFRRATPYFDSDWYAKTYELSASKAPIVDFILAGDDNGQQPSPDINLTSFPKATSVGETSRLETAVRELSRKVARLSDGSMADLIAHAASLEPLIMKPDGLRNMRYPPMKCATVPVRERSRKLQAALTRQQYKSIVLIPHCRMSGATRIGGELLQALNDIYADEPVLLVLTDLSVFERPDWFGDNFDLLDFAEIADGLNRNQKQLLLLDLLRGVQPERIVNVNSSLCWDVYETYGKQMKTWAELYVYLFCYDIDPCGNKVGYPIRNLQRVFDHLSGVMVDNSTLAEELKTRYRLPAKLRQRVHTLFTPERPSTHNLSANFARRRSAGGAMRALWAGRFDRQKRFDLVIEIANQMPDLEIWAYGKPVLQDVTYDLDALPRNIRLEEPYKHVDDVPLEIFDFYLYTSEWDGLPTILIEMGMRGMTVVSSDVGGISDLVTPETGWPVADALNPSAYVEAIAELARTPDAATGRASALKARVLEMCTHERYLKTARGVFVADRAPMRTASAGHPRVERPLVESLSTSAIQS
ncbi:MAG: glycosyltransferase, partial [Pseudomonadota bacterium]